MTRRVLLISNEYRFALPLKQALEARGFDVRHARTLQEAHAEIAAKPAHRVIITSLTISGGTAQAEGLHLAASAKLLHRQTKVYLLCEYAEQPDHLRRQFGDLSRPCELFAGFTYGELVNYSFLLGEGIEPLVESLTKVAPAFEEGTSVPHAIDQGLSIGSLLRHFPPPQPCTP